MDILIRLESQISTTQVASEVCLVYMDPQGAFDTVRICGLLYKLAQAGLCGALSRWLHAYLNYCTACVRVNGVLSEAPLMLAEVPQGAVLYSSILC
jgi:hypothetical protein